MEHLIQKKYDEALKLAKQIKVIYDVDAYSVDEMVDKYRKQ